MSHCSVGQPASDTGRTGPWRAVATGLRHVKRVSIGGWVAGNGTDLHTMQGNLVG